MIITEEQALNEGFFADKLGGVFDKIKAMLNTEVDVEAVGRKQSEAMQQVERDLKKAGIDTAKMKATIQRNVDAMDQNALRECMGVDGSQLLSEGFKERAEEIINQTFLQTFKDVYSELKSKSGDEITMGLMILIVIWLYFNQTQTGFLVIGAFAGIAMAGVQSVSRTMVGVLTPPAQSGEFYGFFSIVGRTSSFIGPAVYGWLAAEAALWYERQGVAVTSAEQMGQRVAILSIAVFLAAGLFVLRFVNEERGRATAAAHSA